MIPSIILRSDVETLQLTLKTASEVGNFPPHLVSSRSQGTAVPVFLGSIVTARLFFLISL